MPRPAKPKPNPSSIGMWTAIRDIVVMSMRKGQLPVLGVIGLIGLVLYKTPTEYFPQLWAQIFTLKGSIFVVSLTLNVVLPVGWAVHLRVQRRWFNEEISRIVGIRNELQQKQIGTIESSDQ